MSTPTLRKVKPSTTAPAVHAAGAVVWRRAKRGIEVLLVHRPSYDDWSWPKGKLEPGETLPACAVREIAEETGVQVVLGQQLPAVRYRLGDGRLKVCHYWAAEVAVQGEAAVRARVGVGRCDPGEVDRAAWVSVAEARRVLTRRSDRAPFDALLDLWDDGALETKAFVLLRHARAKKRSAWRKGDETDRPLTAQGLHHAVDLTATLSAFGVGRVASSPWERCVATVRPYAELADVPLELIPEITESEAQQEPARARRVFGALLRALRPHAGDPGEPSTAVCAHRPVLPLLLEALATHSPNRVQELLPSVDPYLKTGEMLVAHVQTRHRRGLRVVAVERHRVPR